MGDEEADDGPTVVYMPLNSPFDSRDSGSDDEFESRTQPPKVVAVPEPATAQESTTFGGDASKKRKLSTGEAPPSRRQHRDAEDTPSTSLVESSPKPGDSLLGPPTAQNADSRGRSLHRTSSSSSLDERSRSYNGSSPVSSHSPESSRASSTSTRGTSAEIGIVTLTGRDATTANGKVNTVGPTSGSAPIADDAIIPHDDYVKLDSESPGVESSKSATKQESGSGFVDKAVANARGLIGTILSGSSAVATGKRNTS
ncbi:hypothetical protein FRC17_008139 [Serendipita sp. 399]|nr:hypothetical protein FRC17_008139 [Serendipita sp. 399]